MVVAVGDPFSFSASWAYTETAGLSCILVSLIRRRLLQGFLMTTHAWHIHASAPLEAEALTLNWALDYISTAITSDDEKEYVIYIDCKILSTAIQMNNVQDLPYWEATQTVAQCRKGGLEGTTHAGKLGAKNQRKLQQLSKCQI